MKSFIKDPDAVLDYTFDWTDWLSGGDAINYATVFGEDGITVNSIQYDDSSVTAWLSGGTAGRNYMVTCRVITDQGRTDDRSVLIVVQEQ